MAAGFLKLQPTPEAPTAHKVGWLELFYDLVYVATVIALGNRLSDDISRDGVLTFAVLFVPIWWTWTGMAFYITRFNLDDVGHRLLVFVQMFAIAVLAIHTADGLGETSQMFALAYVAGRVILVLMYLRVGEAVPAMRPLAQRYAQGFSLAAAIWLISVLVPAPARFGFWAVGLLVDFGTPLLPSTRRLQAASPPSAHHLPERFGLFTIIVLGEAFIKVITGAEGHTLHLENAFYGALALIIAASLWWIYFDNIDGAVVRRTRFAGQVWVYTHLPLVAAITAFGVAAKKVVLLEPGYALADEKRLLFAGAVATTLFAIAILDLTTSERTEDLTHNPGAVRHALGAAIILALGLFASPLSVPVFVTAIALVCVAQVALDLRHRQPRQASAHAEHA